MATREQKALWMVEVDKVVALDNGDNYSTNPDDYLSLDAVTFNQVFKSTKEVVSYCYTRREQPSLFPSHIFEF